MDDALASNRRADARPSGFQVTVALLGGLVLLLDGFDTQAISYALPAIASEWHLPPAALGPTLSAALAGMMVGYLGVSPLSDRFGPKRVIVLSTAAFGLLTLSAVLVGSLPQLIAVRFLVGVALGAAAPAVVTMTDACSPPRLRSTFVVAIYGGFSLGFVAAGLAAETMMAVDGWRSLFWLGALPPLALVPILALALPTLTDPDIRRDGPAGQVPAASHKAFGGRAPEPVWSRFADTFHFARERRAIGTALLWLIFIINLAAFYLIQAWLPTLLTRLHRDLATTATATSLTTVGGIAAAFVVGPVMDRVGPYRPLTAIYGVGAICVALLGVALPAQLWQLYAAAFCAGFCVSGGQKSAVAAATLFYPAPVRSGGVGWALGIGRAGGIAGPLLAGALLGAGWSPAGLFCVVAAGMLASAVAAAAIGFRYGASELQPMQAYSQPPQAIR